MTPRLYDFACPECNAEEVHDFSPVNRPDLGECRACGWVGPMQLTEDDIMPKTIPAPAAEPTDLLEAAWGLIANAGEGDWSRESTEWQEAAARWRDRYHLSPATDVVQS